VAKVQPSHGQTETASAGQRVAVRVHRVQLGLETLSTTTR
jgi:hypothetical protein